MKNRQLLIYLLVNVVISAVTTLSVLFFWNLNTQGQNIFCSPTNNPTFLPASLVIQTSPPLNQPVLVIENVFGVGQINDEVVVIKRISDGDLDLNGWKLVDEQKHEFGFPPLTLTKGSINIYSRFGQDSAKDLYWNQIKPIWQTGEKVKMIDPLGNVRSEYIIP